MVAAIFVILMEDVFDARMALGDNSAERVRKMLSLMAKFSATACHAVLAYTYIIDIVDDGDEARPLLRMKYVQIVMPQYTDSEAVATLNPVRQRPSANPGVKLTPTGLRMRMLARRLMHHSPVLQEKTGMLHRTGSNHTNRQRAAAYSD